MAKQDLLCVRCAGRRSADVTTEEPGVRISVIYGALKLDMPLAPTIVRDLRGAVIKTTHHAFCRCDVCGVSLQKGERVACSTMWQGFAISPTQAVAWVDEYLEQEAAG
jgi:hypothetical protein